MNYFIYVGYDLEGPMTIEQIKAMLATGQVQPDASATPEDQEQWRPIGDILRELEPPEPAPAPIAATPELPPVDPAFAATIIEPRRKVKVTTNPPSGIMPNQGTLASAPAATAPVGKLSTAASEQGTAPVEVSKTTPAPAQDPIAETPRTDLKPLPEPAIKIPQADRADPRSPSGTSVSPYVVTDIEIPFPRLIAVMFKVCMAAIPGIIVLAMMAGILVFIFNALK
ncbi:MAG: DUF4339 domain-containing protein [Verrucomicrobiota bacterium]|nr:DUF4339 domain-containing protein [Verrucomicrobiota bacterium]